MLENAAMRWRLLHQSEAVIDGAKQSPFPPSLAMFGKMPLDIFLPLT